MNSRILSLCQFLLVSLTVVAEDAIISPPLISPDNLPHNNSFDGIRNLDLNAIPSSAGYEINVTFEAPYNLLSKAIHGYYYTVYKFKNETHLSTQNFQDSTPLSEDVRSFTVRGLQYNVNYYIQLMVYYAGEPLNYAYAGVKHFNHAGSSRGFGKFSKSDDYIFAPRFRNSNVTRHANGTYKLTTRWHLGSDLTYQNFIERFVLNIRKVDTDEYFASSILQADKDMTYTFYSIPSMSEYQVAISAIPKTEALKPYFREHTAARRFFTLFYK